MSAALQLDGKKFGKLFVLKLSHKNNHNSYFECLCDCGNLKIIKGEYLNNGDTKSCGCLKKYRKEKSVHWKGYKEISGQLFRQISYGVKRRNLEFDITIEQIWDLFLKQNRECALTGIELNFQSSDRLRDRTASLDRIDSNIGYILNNVQWVHKDVNNMKQDYPQNKFIEYCRLIVKKNL